MDKKVQVPILIGLIAAYYALVLVFNPRINGIYGLSDYYNRWGFTKLQSPFHFITPIICVAVFILTYKGVKAGMGKGKIEGVEFEEIE